MAKAFRAVVRQATLCPMELRQGSELQFELPAVRMEDAERICGHAIQDLLPIVQRLERLVERGKPVEVKDTVSCTGCRRLGAFVEFGLEHASRGFGAVDESSRDVIESLKRFKIFSALPDRALVKIGKTLKRKELERGRTILQQGQRGLRLYLIDQGEVEVVAPDESGNETSIATIPAGECFGEMSLLTGEPVSASIRSRSDVVLMVLEKGEFDRILVQNPGMNLYFNRVLIDRLRKTSNYVIDQLEKGMVGQLSQIPPGDLMQALNVTERDGILTLQDAGKEVSIVLKGGQAWDLRSSGAANADPVEAFYDFLTWRSGTFRLENYEQVPERKFFVDMTSLLLEGMRRIDEAGAR